MITATQKSLDILRDVSSRMNSHTFHHHSHILFDIPIRDGGFYVEIGCYAGATACLMLHKKNINVISIDLGFPISKEIVSENINIFNKNENYYKYIQGNSNSNNTLIELKNITEKIDILFIDGDHSYQGVLSDFLMYADLVAPGGYVVFDDYNDIQHSPEVKPAVNQIVNNFKNYEIIGTIKNNFKARPDNLLEGNCFIIKKNYE